MIGPEGKGSVGTVHDCRRVESAEYACLVILGRRKSGMDCIVLVRQSCLADRTGSFMEWCIGKASFGCTVEAEDVSVASQIRGADGVTGTYEQVVTTASSVS